MKVVGYPSSVTQMLNAADVDVSEFLKSYGNRMSQRDRLELLTVSNVL